MTTKWSVGIETTGDRIVQLEEVVELADAVATSGGIATGIGTNHYGAQIVVVAATREEAIEKGKATFTQAVQRAGLPAFPITRVEVVSEEEDAEPGDEE